MKATRLIASFLAAILSVTLPVQAQLILNVVETGGDNEATDTISARWTGQIFNVSVANEPFPGAVIGNPFTVPTFGSSAPTFVDRNARYFNNPTNISIPGYLVGSEYIMSGNDNRDNATYRLDVTVSTAARVYMLIDNRLNDGSGANPPTFTTTNMQWILDQGWLATANGLNRTLNLGVPDEVPLDEGADDTINNWYSVYYKDFAAGTFALLQPDNAGRNMYGVVISVVPEPGTLALFALGAAVILFRRRK